jgi:hypothetical protein
MNKAKNNRVLLSKTFYTPISFETACADIENPRELYEGNGFSKWRIIEQDETSAMFHAVMTIRHDWSRHSVGYLSAHAVLQRYTENVTRIDLQVGFTWRFWLAVFALVIGGVYIFWAISQGLGWIGVLFLALWGMTFISLVTSAMAGQIRLVELIIGALGEEDKYLYFEPEAIS